MKLKYGSLFSGVGGFDMGFDLEGYECVFQVEWDKHCQQILAKHWPEVPKWLDVQEVNGAEVPPCDVLTFGSPCQDLSVAGKRAGLDGGRSSMFYEATRIIKEMRNATESVYPRVVVWENVPGALSSNNGADFGQVLDTLAECGAVDIQWSILDAQHFGVPQRRRRIFVVAIFDPTAAEQCPETLLPVIKGSRGDFKKSRTARKNATGHATPSVDSSGQWAAGSTDEDILSTSVCSKWAKGSGGQLVVEAVAYDEYNDSINETHHAIRAGTKQSTGVIQPILSFDTQFGSNANVFEDQAPTLKATQQSPPVAYDTTPQQVEQQLAVRRLTPLECERLMGWPDDHTRWTASGKEQADTNRYKQCGNGVATPVAAWIAKHIKALL